MKTFTDEQLCNSQTLQKLSALSMASPINTNDTAEINCLLASSLVYLIDSLDKDGIDFKNSDDAGALWQMMLACYQVVCQIRPETKTQH